MAGKPRREDRRTRYTKQVIKQAFFELLHERGFGKTSVAEVCKRAEINRGTFYLHYEDKYALLEEVVDEAIDAEPMLDGTTPVSMCQRVPVNEDYRLLYTDRELYPFVARRVVARGEAEGVSSIMERTGLSERDAQTLFAFTANGNLAVNQALGWRRGQEFLQAQALIRDFIAAGYEGVRHG